MKKKCTSLVYVPELLPEDIFSHLVCHHADQVRAQNAYRAMKRRKIRERRFIAAILIFACVTSLTACLAIARVSGIA